MYITGEYNQYMLMSNLLAPATRHESGDMVQGVFTSAMAMYQDRVAEAAFSEESAKALSDLFINASDLAAKAGILTLGDYGSVFFERLAATSDAQVLTASVRPSYTPNAEAAMAQYALEVSQLATTQENRGTELVLQDLSLANAGHNTFSVEIGEENYLLGVDVALEDTVHAVLEKISVAINEASLGLTAQVYDEGKDGTGYLVLTAHRTGNAGAFHVADVSGNAIQATGAGTVFSFSQDAIYTLDGAPGVSSANTLYLDEGRVAVDLHSPGQAVLEVVPDSGAIARAIGAFMEEVNRFSAFLKENQRFLREDIQHSVTTIIQDHARELAPLGITVGDDTYLRTDTEVLGRMVTEKFSIVRDVFSGFDGMAVQASRLSSRIISSRPVVLAKEYGSLTQVPPLDLGYRNAALATQSLLDSLTRGGLVNLFA